MKKLILASGSPRRKEVLKIAGWDFDVIASDVEEKLLEGLTNVERIKAIALSKAKQVSATHPDAVVIGADTMILFNDELLGKPKDEMDAKKILRKLSGTTNVCITAFAIVSDAKIVVDHTTTEIDLREISDEEIEWYVNTKEPMDKAGAYAVQGLGAVFVKEIRGDYFGILGLPISKIVKELEEFGFKL